MEQSRIINHYSKGFRDGIPIALGYLSVSFTFGMAASAQGLALWQAVFISMTNVTSAGQFAGLSLMAAGAPYLEMILTQFIINLRYALMSVSLSQRLNNVGILDRLVISFCNTDEIFAVASRQPAEVGRRYMYGLMTAPYLGWVAGTLVGAAASALLPDAIRSALGIAIYGMFIAIVLPPAKKLRAVRLVAGISALLSCAFAWVPGLNRVSGGFAVILCTVIASTVGALLFPIEEAQSE